MSASYPHTIIRASWMVFASRLYGQKTSPFVHVDFRPPPRPCTKQILVCMSKCHLFGWATYSTTAFSGECSMSAPTPSANFSAIVLAILNCKRSLNRSLKQQRVRMNNIDSDVLWPFKASADLQGTRRAAAEPKSPDSILQSLHCETPLPASICMFPDTSSVMRKWTRSGTWV